MTTEQVAETVTQVVAKQKQDPEIGTMGRILSMLKPLDPDARVRVLRWNLERAIAVAQCHREVGEIQRQMSETKILPVLGRAPQATADFG